MKRLGIILLSLSLIAAFSTAALAVDLKFSGEFYVAGMYLDRTTLKKDTATDGPSTAFYFQRLRLKTDFIVSPGLTLVTRLDAMERAWGATRSTPGTTQVLDSAGTAAENENIVFDWAYIDYKSPIGVFNVGYMNYGATGTIFGNNIATQPRIKYSYMAGQLTINAALSKIKDKSYTAKNATASAADADNDVYHLECVYRWKGGRAGLNVNYYRTAENRPASDYKTTYFLITPYTMAKIGPVALQAELNYATGKTREYDSGAGDIKMENWSGWIDATATFGPIYFGGTFAYVSGDDTTTADKQEGGNINGGRDWNPCLILFNYYDRTYWVGALAGNGTSTNRGPMSNAFFYQGRVGVKPTDKLDIMASLSYSNADKKPAGYVSDTYGYEVDVTGTYKITNNLSYMLGVGYLITGDYFKGNSPTSSVRDDYMVINKLTLIF
jgi:hypothetical protein